MHETAPLRLGFIGGALDSAIGYTHFASSRVDRQWDLVAGCFSLNPKLNAEAARAYGVPSDRTYSPWQEMLRNEKRGLDAVAILTPTPSHFELVMTCLNEGFPVICEKALAENSAEAAAILEARNRNRGFLAVTYNYSGYPMVRELRKRIRDGSMGRILHFQAEMPQEGFVRVDSTGNKFVPQKWRLADKRIPTLHLDLAVHVHQLIGYLTGLRPEEVISNQDSYGWFPAVIDNVHCLCRYSGGVDGQIWFSKSALGHRNGLRLRIYGSDAAAEWFQGNPEELTISYKDGRKEIVDRAAPTEVAREARYNRFKAGHPAGYIEAFANLYRDIATSLRQYRTGGTWVSDEVFSVELAAEGLRMSEAMVMSSEKKTWQAVAGLGG